MTASPNFSIFYAGDAYSTANKIMGRQSAGKAFIQGMARTWPNGAVRGLGPSPQGGQALARQLRGDGYTGQVRWSCLPDLHSAGETGALYFPSPGAKDLAHLRNLASPGAFSLMGVTFTLSSKGALDQVAELILPPYRPWDALICISQCAREMVTALHAEMRDWWTDQLGPVRFNAPQLPVIPLGVDAPAFAPDEGLRGEARRTLGVGSDECVFLFSGRLSFHAKANPAPMYQALEKAARQRPVVCVEAGVFPNEAIRNSYLAAQAALAPSVRFIQVDGQDEPAYRRAWRAADVFVSLSDNIQETFGLTPIEAMAAGLPVVVADWNGYRETVRDGVDGFRIPTVLPPAGSGADLAIRHALEVDSYDLYIGRTSLATVVEPQALAGAIGRLAGDAALRKTMGAAGLARARQEFDWPVILPRYAELATHLAGIRQAAPVEAARSWPQRADPFARFGHFSTSTVEGDWAVCARPDAPARLQSLFSLAMSNYAFDPGLLSREAIVALLEVLRKDAPQTVNSLLAAAGQASPAGLRALMWLAKFDLVLLARPGVSVPAGFPADC